MVAKNPYAQYTNINVNTASREELTLMLYEGSLKFSNQAVVAIEKKDYNKAHELIMRVEDIIREFQITLDFNYEISNNLNAMYDYMYRLLVDANFNKDIEPIKEVIGYLREFRDTWKEAMKIAKLA